MSTKSGEKQSGFTLVELLVVIAIIGLLSGMVVVSLNNTKAKSRDAERVSEINSIATVLGLYHNDNNHYPVYEGKITGSDSMSVELQNSGFITAVPTDPSSRDDASDCGATIGGYYYYYESIDPGTDYYLGFCLETNSVFGRAKGENGVVP